MAEPRLLMLTVAHVDGPIFDGEVQSVVLPGVAGDMEILAHHEPLISLLRAGEGKIKKVDGSIETFKITVGTLEISHNHATVLI